MLSVGEAVFINTWAGALIADGAMLGLTAPVDCAADASPDFCRSGTDSVLGGRDVKQSLCCGLCSNCAAAAAADGGVAPLSISNPFIG